MISRKVHFGPFGVDVEKDATITHGTIYHIFMPLSISTYLKLRSRGHRRPSNFDDSRHASRKARKGYGWRDEL